jgi:hypothetical protein
VTYANVAKLLPRLGATLDHVQCPVIDVDAAFAASEWLTPTASAPIESPRSCASSATAEAVGSASGAWDLRTAIHCHPATCAPIACYVDCLSPQYPGDISLAAVGALALLHWLAL